ncbi:50S ribosomal protein L10 [Serinicoccus sp. CUA-874]|uniref:50S ribosomal protein L10 n=1 Tax=Serinicoccus TaxID=265976 RepID=UPI0003B5B24D|nr:MULTISPECIES: 50S ribosomal protein L10 [Serinicoccus]OLT18438.1 50S ribosomal protein L10 [Serinicoccus sp. CUA-874]
MATPEKVAAIAELTEKFRSSGGAVLTEYRGLRVSQITELRASMREHATYAVVKNTLTKRAAAEAGIDGLDEHLQGPTAIAFVTGDPVEAAKGLRDFAKANPALVIKAGVLDGKSLTPDEITTLADLESREVLLAKLAGAMKGNLSKAVGLFAAPMSTTARVVESLRAKVEEQGGSAAATESAPADEADTTAEAAEPAEATTDVAEGGDES